MITRGAHHISLTVRDLPSAIEFYGEVLGLPEIDRPDFGIPGKWYQAGSVQLHLIGAPEGYPVPGTPDGVTPLANHIAFEIEDYEAVRERLESRGFEVKPLGSEVGQMFTADPHGNIIEFIKPGGRLGR